MEGVVIVCECAQVWNFRQLAAMFTTIAFVFVNLFAEEEQAIIVVGSVAQLFSWSGLLHYARGFNATAAKVRAIMKISYDMVPFMIVLFMVIVSFAFALRSLFARDRDRRDEECEYEDEDGDIDCTRPHNSGYRTLFTAFVTTTFAGVFGDLDLDAIYEYSLFPPLTCELFVSNHNSAQTPTYLLDDAGDIADCHERTYRVHGQIVRPNRRRLEGRRVRP